MIIDGNSTCHTAESAKRPPPGRGGAFNSWWWGWGNEEERTSHTHPPAVGLGGELDLVVEKLRGFEGKLCLHYIWQLGIELHGTGQKLLQGIPDSTICGSWSREGENNTVQSNEHAWEQPLLRGSKYKVYLKVP